MQWQLAASNISQMGLGTATTTTLDKEKLREKDTNETGQPARVEGVGGCREGDSNSIVPTTASSGSILDASLFLSPSNTPA